MEANPHWTPVVERFLQASYEDQKRGRKAMLTNSLSEFYRECGSESLAEVYAARVKARFDTLRAPAPSSDWILISGSEHSVMVEIPVSPDAGSKFSNQVPFFPTRLVLMKSDDSWKLDDILHPCIGCNTNYQHRQTTIGQCSLCEGLGHLRLRPEFSCRHCNGTGVCPNCGKGSTVGWNRASFLRSIS